MEGSTALPRFRSGLEEEEDTDASDDGGGSVGGSKVGTAGGAAMEFGGAGVIIEGWDGVGW